MSDQLYMRVKGRIMGPYDREKLHSLARRGQLSRLHEVSEDGVSWVRASTFPDLFDSRAGDDGPSARGGPGTSVVPVQPSAAVPAPGQQWYYLAGGSQYGPVDFQTLRTVANSGQLGPDDRVWADGIGDWQPAGQVAGLLLQQPTPNQGASRSPEHSHGSKALDRSLVRAATESRPWASFMMVIAIVSAILLVIGGMFSIIIGARARVAGGVAAGILELVQAVIVLAAAYLLNNYTTPLAKLDHSGSAEDLESALSALRTFWIFVSINVIVWLAFLLVMVIAAFATGVTLPGW